MAGRKGINRETGAWGENFAVAILLHLGYDIVEQNYHSRYGEIDIIASQGDFICFVEVKTRRENSMVGGVEAVTPSKQKKIIRTALQYLQRSGCDLQPRFDIFSVTTKGREVTGWDYLTGAFNGDGI